MLSFAAALTPVLVLIAIGFALRRSHFLPEATWSGIERLTYFVLFPALLIRTLGTQTLTDAAWPAILTVVGVTLAVAAALLIVLHRLRPLGSNATFTSVFQGGVRFNTYIMLAVAQAFFGAAGLAAGAVAAGFMIVLINLLCISVFVVYGQSGKRGYVSLLREIIVNPLILACIVGWLLSLTGIGLPGVVEDVFEIIGRAALPLGLLAVGAALRPEAVRGHVGAITVSSLVQFGLKPLCVVLLSAGVGLDAVATGVLVIAFTTPTAPSAYILARQLGGDTETMASIITFQTLLAFAVMPLVAGWALR